GLMLWTAMVIHPTRALGSAPVILLTSAILWTIPLLLRTEAHITGLLPGTVLRPAMLIHATRALGAAMMAFWAAILLAVPFLLRTETHVAGLTLRSTMVIHAARALRSTTMMALWAILLAVPFLLRTETHITGLLPGAVLRTVMIVHASRALGSAPVILLTTAILWTIPLLLRTEAHVAGLLLLLSGAALMIHATLTARAIAVTALRDVIPGAAKAFATLLMMFLGAVATRSTTWAVAVRTSWIPAGARGMIGLGLGRRIRLGRISRRRTVGLLHLLIRRGRRGVLTAKHRRGERHGSDQDC
ncbi:MAG: hypothetical protein JWO08_2759, partial [Verrucomicrobiaceae bacterium]|nr:hypothetical protein [Verrucomicrobiaceae bacterium]